MNEPSIHARLESLRHLGGGVFGGWGSFTKDFTCRLKINWDENSTVSQGGRMSNFSDDKSEFVDVKWNKGCFIQALNDIRRANTWSEITYRNTSYFNKKNHTNELPYLQTILEAEMERDTLKLTVDNVSTFQQY